MVTSVSRLHIDAFGTYLKSVYPETKTSIGRVLDYVEMTFDFNKEGEVRITMDNCVADILSGCGEFFEGTDLISGCAGGLHVDTTDTKQDAHY